LRAFSVGGEDDGFSGARELREGVPLDWRQCGGGLCKALQGVLLAGGEHGGWRAQRRAGGLDGPPGLELAVGVRDLSRGWTERVGFVDVGGMLLRARIAASRGDRVGQQWQVAAGASDMCNELGTLWVHDRGDPAARAGGDGGYRNACTMASERMLDGVCVSVCWRVCQRVCVVLLPNAELAMELRDEVRCAPLLSVGGRADESCCEFGFAQESNGELECVIAEQGRLDRVDVDVRVRGAESGDAADALPLECVSPGEIEVDDDGGVLEVHAFCQQVGGEQ
jgi:hypothetical protein